MAFPRIKALGWAFLEILTSAQQTQLDIDHANAIDGAGGGTYAPSSLITINGVGLQVLNFTSEIGGTFLISAGVTTLCSSSFTFAGGGSLGGAWVVPNGASATVQSGGSFTTSIGASCTLNSPVSVTGTCTVSGTLTCNASSQVNLQGIVNIASTAATTCFSTITLSGHGHILKRLVYITDPGGSITIGINDGDLFFCENSTIAADRNLIVSDVGAAVPAMIRIYMNQNSHALNLKQADGTTNIVEGSGATAVVLQNATAGNWKYVDLFWAGANSWKVIGGLKN